MKSVVGNLSRLNNEKGWRRGKVKCLRQNEKEIYFKDSKNGKAIKKFIFWKSNKEKVGDFPSYLCYYLDYSDGREDPIKKKIYPFEDEKIGLDFLKSLMDENIKKGWEKFNGS